MWTRVALLNQFTSEEVKLLDRLDIRLADFLHDY